MNLDYLHCCFQQAVSLSDGFWPQHRPALLLLVGALNGGTLSIVLSLSASHYQNSSWTLISSWSMMQPFLNSLLSFGIEEMTVHVFMGTTAPRFSILTTTSLLFLIRNRSVPGLLCGSVMSRLGSIFADLKTSVGAAILFNLAERSKCLRVHYCLSSEENERTVCLCSLKSLLTAFSDLEANLISSLDWK